MTTNWSELIEENRNAILDAIEEVENNCVVAAFDPEQAVQYRWTAEMTDEGEISLYSTYGYLISAKVYDGTSIILHSTEEWSYSALRGMCQEDAGWDPRKEGVGILDVYPEIEEVVEGAFDELVEKYQYSGQRQ